MKLPKSFITGAVAIALLVPLTFAPNRIDHSSQISASAAKHHHKKSHHKKNQTKTISTDTLPKNVTAQQFQSDVDAFNDAVIALSRFTNSFVGNNPYIFYVNSSENDDPRYTSKNYTGFSNSLKDIAKALKDNESLDNHIYGHNYSKFNYGFDHFEDSVSALDKLFGTRFSAAENAKLQKLSNVVATHTITKKSTRADAKAQRKNFRNFYAELSRALLTLNN